MATFTVYFDGQFWVGVLEEQSAGQLRAVRVVFGAEPSDAELYDWVQRNGRELFERLDEAAAVPAEASVARRGNPKRAQREAAREARMPEASTAAQRALKADQEIRGTVAATDASERREAEAERRRALKRARARAKHRGH